MATLVDGVLTRVDPDPAHPTGQALCVKAKAAPEAVYAPDRILIDEALEFVASKVRAATAQQVPRPWPSASPNAAGPGLPTGSRR